MSKSSYEVDQKHQVMGKEWSRKEIGGHKRSSIPSWVVLIEISAAASSFHSLERDPKALYLGQRRGEVQSFHEYQGGALNIKSVLPLSWKGMGGTGLGLLLRILPSFKYPLFSPQCPSNPPPLLNPRNLDSPCSYTTYVYYTLRTTC